MQDISVGDLAKMCSTSEGNFRRLFKKYKNMSPITYRNYLRIKKSVRPFWGAENTASPKLRRR
ncbi:MAG: AraC family transcriptional regulator [Clostridiales bacterium]|nr:MAG: AraC family transcriptional regulator [Clostridiales bacterium]